MKQIDEKFLSGLSVAELSQIESMARMARVKKLDRGHRIMDSEVRKIAKKGCIIGISGLKFRFIVSINIQRRSAFYCSYVNYPNSEKKIYVSWINKIWMRRLDGSLKLLWSRARRCRQLKLGR